MKVAVWIIAICLLLMVGACALFALAVGDAANEVSQELDEIIAPTSALEFAGDIELRRSQLGLEAVGNIRNKSDQYVGYAQVSCQLYQSGVQVDDSLDNTSGIAAGATWRFRVLFLQDHDGADYNVRCRL